MMFLPYLVILLLGIQSVLGFLKSRSVFSPIFIVPVIWFILISLYYILPHDLFPLKRQFLVSISLWTSMFFIGGLLIDSTNAQKINLQRNSASIRFRGILFYLTCLMSPIVCYLLYKQAIDGPTPNFFINLRVINIGESTTGFSLGIFMYAFNLAFISLLLELMEAEKARLLNYRVIVLFGLNLMLALLTVGRLLFLNIFVAVIVILFFKGLIRKKHFLIFGIVILSLFLAVTLLRSSDESVVISELIFDTLKVYSFSSMPAFDTLEHQQSGMFGVNVFRFYYAIAQSMGANVPVVKTIYDYAEVPYLTNVYTVMYIFFVDFGYTGVALGGFLFGLFYQFFFKLSLGKNKPAIIFFSFLFPTLLTQFTGEFLLTNMSNTLQFFFIIFVPYVFYKRAQD